MKKYLFFLAAFLGALGIGLFWFGLFIENIKETSHAAGKSECEAAYEKQVVLKLEKVKEVENEQINKKVNIWARPNSRLPSLIKRMRAKGIGTVDNNSKNSDLSGRRH